MRRDRSLEEDRDDRPPRRPWVLIAACLVLVVLTAVLWGKWSDTRREAAKLHKEMTRVYKEAEDLRLQAALAQERIGKLERQLRALHADRAAAAKPPDGKARGAKPPARR